MNLPRGVLTGPNLEIFAAALKKFGAITKQNEGQVRAWIHAERSRRGLASAPCDPPDTVRPFGSIADLESEEGWK